jgi:hypothetical protein
MSSLAGIYQLLRGNQRAVAAHGPRDGSRPATPPQVGGLAAALEIIIR